VHRWNDFLGPLIYLRDEAKYPFSLALQYFQGAHEVEWGNLMAFSTLVVLPVLIIFFFTQRTFIQGIKLSGIKG
jgi:multiple sugar transport system permease protein